MSLWMTSRKLGRCSNNLERCHFYAGRVDSTKGIPPNDRCITLGPCSPSFEKLPDTSCPTNIDSQCESFFLTTACLPPMTEEPSNRSRRSLVQADRNAGASAGSLHSRIERAAVQSLEIAQEFEHGLDAASAARSPIAINRQRVFGSIRPPGP